MCEVQGSASEQGGLMGAQTRPGFAKGTNIQVHQFPQREETFPQREQTSLKLGACIIR